MSAPRHCPKCGEALPVAGGDHCPQCQLHFVAMPDLEIGDEPVVRLQDLPPPPRPLQPVLVSSESEPLPPPAGPPDLEREWRRCPRCSARVRQQDGHCFLCGVPLRWRDDEGDEAGPARRDYEPHRGLLISWLAKLSLITGGLSFAGILFLPLAALSVVAAATGIGVVVMARDDLDLMERQIMDPAGRQATLSGQSSAMVGLVLGIAGAILSLLVRMPSLLA